jgi:SAM-dependent methyltransferase
MAISDTTPKLTSIVSGSAETGKRAGAFRLFWENAGENIPPFSEASSTRYYLDCERYLFERYFGDLRGKTLYKTDLWDEAKNTRILVWAAGEKGAAPVGLDISLPIVRQARRHFAGLRTPPRFVVSDIRSTAFRDDSFDYLYSMGTVEHFPNCRLGLEECFRVLKPGGTAIIGVPNKLDPFLRPLQVAALNRLGLYAYGYEKSFTPGELERILRSIGFKVVARTGILFLPGWLRILDLFLYIKRPSWTVGLKPFIAPFAWLYWRSDTLKRAGYLCAAVVRKPDLVRRPARGRGRASLPESR